MRLVKTFYFLIAFFISLMIVHLSLSYFSPDFSKGFLRDKEEIFWHYKFALFAHVIAAPIVILLGIVQFLFTKTKWHKRIGMAYSFSVLLFAAPSGLYMAFFAPHWGATLSFVILSCLWFWVTLKAFLLAKKKNYILHERFMIRSFILANSAIALRIISYLHFKFGLFPEPNPYVWVSWLSWLPFLLVYEGMLFYKKGN